jgi:hypothetical protein
MPQIKEYNQQVGIEGGFSTISINPSIEGQQGRAIQQAGAAVTNVADTMVKIAESKEIADNSQKISELRLKYTERLMNEVNTGQLSLDKLNEDFDNELAQMGDGITTRGASDYFIKSGQALKDSLSMDALKAQAEITSVKIKNSTLKSLNAAQATLMVNPTKLNDVKTQYANDVRAMTIDGKLIDAKVAEKMIAEGNRELDVAQFRGLMRISSEENLPKLYDALRSGAFLDRDFSTDTQKGLEAEIRTEMAARASERNRIKDLNSKAEESAQEALMSKFLDDAVSGQKKYTRLDIVRSGLKPSKAISLISSLDSLGARQDRANNKSLKNEAYQKMLLPEGDKDKIYSIEQLRPYLERTDPETGKWLLSQFNASKTPEEKVSAKLKSQYIVAAKTALGIDPASKIVDPKAAEILSSLTDEFESEYSRKRAEGIHPSEMLTREGKHSLFYIIDSHRRGLNERIADYTNNMKSGNAGKKPLKEDGTPYSATEWSGLSEEEKKKARQRNTGK